MAALWLQSVFLLVLLVVSWPSTRADIPPERLCDSQLMEDVLNKLCGDQVFFNPLTGRVNGNSGTRKLRMPRSMLPDCCLRPCNRFDLQNYCF